MPNRIAPDCGNRRRVWRSTRRYRCSPALSDVTAGLALLAPFAGRLEHRGIIKHRPVEPRGDVSRLHLGHEAIYRRGEAFGVMRHRSMHRRERLAELFVQPPAAGEAQHGSGEDRPIVTCAGSRTGPPAPACPPVPADRSSGTARSQVSPVSALCSACASRTNHCGAYVVRLATTWCRVSSAGSIGNRQSGGEHVLVAFPQQTLLFRHLIGVASHRSRTRRFPVPWSAPWPCDKDRTRTAGRCAAAASRSVTPAQSEGPAAGTPDVPQA